MIKLAVFLAPCEEGGFTAYIPSLPGCISEGETIDEALANIREAFELYIEATEDDLIPEEDDAILKELVLDWTTPRDVTAPGEFRPNGPAAADLDPHVVGPGGRPG
jgi:predicted RNase H-like HicB family nuclease